jgi:hypothetical protein
MRVITHIHTTSSYDSISAPGIVARRVAALNADLAVVSDHDSFEGSRRVRSLISVMGIELCVPIAAEIATEFGDVIVVFDTDPKLNAADLKRFEDLVTAARHYEGLLILPHPFKSHKNVEKIASVVDAIEVFNARCTVAENEEAALLCSKLAKAPVFSCDAHFPAEIGLVVAEYSAGKPEIGIYLSNPISATCRPTTQARIACATLVGDLSRRRMKRIPRDVARVLHRSLFDAER